MHGEAVRPRTADLELLATVDEAHENLSGPATRRILERRVEAVNGILSGGRGASPAP